MKPGRPKRTRLRAASKRQLPALTSTSIEALEKALGHNFKDKSLLVTAMTHPSALSAAEAVKHSNQRLEFLGDRVLGLVISDRLLERYPTEREGELAPRFNRLVRKSACAGAARKATLGDHILMGKSERIAGGHERESTLGDVCEAVIGALYLDGGLKVARGFIEQAWAEMFASPPANARDAKSLVQEWAQGKSLPLPDYTVTGREGPDHAPVFHVRLTIEGNGSTDASGPSKQEAERVAAAAMLKKLENNE